MNEGPGSGFLARTGSSSLVFIPLPPPKKILLGLRWVGPFMILFSHFFPCKMCMVFLCTDLLFDLGTPVHASAAAVCWVLGSGTDFCCWPGMWSTLSSWNKCCLQFNPLKIVHLDLC